MTPEHPEWYLITLADLQPRAAVRRFRQSIKDEWGCCAYCGKSKDHLGNPLEITLDHVVPRRWGGDRWARHNMVPACKKCNHNKGSAKDYLDWWHSTDYFCPKRAQKVAAWIQPCAHHWTIGEACHGEIDRGATICSQASSAGGSGAQPSRTHRSLAGVLGGEVSVEGLVHGVQQRSWALVPTG